MQQHSDLYMFAQHFFWLIFPIFGMAMGVFSMWTRHNRAKHGLDLIKSYIDQGKEPPAELMTYLRQPMERDEGAARRHGWVPVCLFAALSAGFVMFVSIPGTVHEPEKLAAFLFAAIVMAGLCIGFLLSALARRRDDQRNPRT